MRNKYLFIIIFLLFGCNQVVSNKKISLEWSKLEYLKGKVKTVTETTYEAEEKFGEVSKGKFRSQIIATYNEDGKMSEYVSLDFSGNVKKKVVITFDEKGNDTESSIYDSHGKLEEKHINEFNEKGNNVVTKVLWMSTPKLWEGKAFSKKFVSTFDDKNQEIEEIEYDYEGDIQGKYTYQYDTRGNRTKVNHYDNDLILNREMIYEYDTDNNNTKIIVSKKLSEFVDEKIQYTGEQEIEQVEVKYDEFGNITELRVVKTKNGEEQIQAFTAKYKLDEKDNYLEKVKYKNGQAIEITERTITYHENKFW